MPTRMKLQGVTLERSTIGNAAREVWKGDYNGRMVSFEWHKDAWRVTFTLTGKVIATVKGPLTLAIREAKKACDT